jgi:DNA-binding NtrC family response regulator
MSVTGRGVLEVGRRLRCRALRRSGTGKELVARAVHECSSRAREPFISLNCSSLSPELIDSELFGHEKGAFTGADAKRKGAFEEAHGGTLFLDEIGELPLELQAKVLRVLENGEVKPVGTSRPFHVDVRVVAATHRDLLAYSREGKFREDLYYRLSGVRLMLPPLRRRQRLERKIVEETLRRCKNNKGRAARELGIARSSLYTRLKEWEHASEDEQEG